MKKILFCLMAGLLVLGVTSCHDQYPKKRKKREFKEKKEIKYYKDTPEYKRQMKEYDRCQDPSVCPEKFERNNRRW